MNMPNAVQGAQIRPRLDGLFSILVGILLMLIAYGSLLEASAIYASYTSCTPGVICYPQPVTPTMLAPLYILVGIGLVVALYSLKMILKGIYSLSAAKDESAPALPTSPASKPSEKTEAKKQEEQIPPPAVQQPGLSTKVDKCPFCGTELPAGATYCPNCFQKK